MNDVSANLNKRSGHNKEAPDGNIRNWLRGWETKSPSEPNKADCVFQTHFSRHDDYFTQNRLVHTVDITQERPIAFQVVPSYIHDAESENIV
jgi:hypothetical protein